MPHARKPLRVVINHEEQYRLVREDRELPHGFRETGKKGTLAELRAELMALVAESRHEQRLEELEELLEAEDRTEERVDDKLPR